MSNLGCFAAQIAHLEQEIGLHANFEWRNFLNSPLLKASFWDISNKLKYFGLIGGNLVQHLILLKRTSCMVLFFMIFVSLQATALGGNPVGKIVELLQDPHNRTNQNQWHCQPVLREPIGGVTFVRSFFRSFICSFIRWFVCLFIRS